MSVNPAIQLLEYGQSVWYDNISRELLDNGEIKRLIEEWGVRGLTSNPSIFEAAIRGTTIYDEQIQNLKSEVSNTNEMFEALAIQDIGAAADLLRAVFEESKGQDGFVSIEVSPLLASDTEGSLNEAKRLYQKLDRPNIMIKIPGTPEGLPAVRALLEEGINVNITLLFSCENYLQVANTYIEALEARVQKGLSVENIRSVASFFVSRVDGKVDAELQKIIDNNQGTEAAGKAKSLLGKFGIANSKVAYHHYQQIFEGAAFKNLKSKGALPQRPLWASTSTKNPEYSDVLYVEGLIGPNTVNTLPHSTLAAFVDHGKAGNTITTDITQALAMEKDLEDLGVSVKQILADLQTEGVKKFSEAFETLNRAIAERM